MLYKEIETATGFNHSEISTDENLADGIYIMILCDRENHQQKFKLVKTSG